MVVVVVVAEVVVVVRKDAIVLAGEKYQKPVLHFIYFKLKIMNMHTTNKYV